MAKQMPFTENLFLYGTLLDAKTRVKALGHQVPTTPDVLRGYNKVEDSDGYPYLQKSTGLVPGVVHGLVANVTTADLTTLDNYESKRYTRIRVQLASGLICWCYEEESHG